MTLYRVEVFAEVAESEVVAEVEVSAGAGVGFFPRGLAFSAEVAESAAKISAELGFFAELGFSAEAEFSSGVGAEAEDKTLLFTERSL